MFPLACVKAFPTGIKPVFAMRLASGRSVTATANHQFLTVDGWTRLDALPVGSCVATPRRVPAPDRTETTTGPTTNSLLLGHLLGDGTMGPNFKYATADLANKAACRRRWPIGYSASVFEGSKLGNTWQLWFPSPYRLTHGVNHPMRNWLEPHGFWKSRAWTKFCPESIFGLRDEQVALFLRHLWATDGSITIGRNGRGPVVRTSYATTSRQLALDVQRLLLRLGVRSTIGTSKKQRAGRPDDDGRPALSGGLQRPRPGCRQPAELPPAVGCHGRRGECIPEALAILEGIKENPNVDLIPWPVGREGP